MRYCRICRDFLPVSRLPRGPRRFMCRTHLWQRTGQKARMALLMKPLKRLLARLWMQGYKDSFKLGHTHIALTQKELGALLDAYARSGGCGNGHSERDGDRHGEAESRAAGTVDRLTACDGASSWAVIARGLCAAPCCACAAALNGWAD